MADAMIVNAGQSVGQGDWDALAAQHGGVKSSSMRPPTEAEIKAAGMAGDDDAAFRQRPIYRYYFNDGTFVEARTAANGADYQVVDYKPSASFTQAQTRAATQAARPQKSEAEQAQEAAQAQTAQVAAARAQADKDEEDWNANPANIKDGASGRRETHRARDERLAKEKQAAEDRQRQDADRNKPSVTIKEDGAGGFVSVQTFPDNRTPVVTPIPGIKGTPAQIKEGGVTYERQPDGTYKPAQGIPNPNTPEPEGAPQPSFTVGDAAANLQKYQEWLNAEMRKPGATLTAARADQLLEARRKLWDTALSEQAGIVNAQQQAFRDQLTQRNQTLTDQQNRRTNATSIANQAQSSYGDLMDKMGANPGGASIAKAIQEARFNAAAFVDNLSGGGVPEIKMGPAYEQTNQMQLNPRAGSPVSTIPQPGAPTPTANALGVGAVGNVPAPTGAPAPAPPQTVFRPAPVAPAPVQAAPPINQQARDTDYRTAPAPVSDPRDAGGYSGPPPMAPAFTPAPQWNPETDPMPDSPGAVSMAPMQPAPWFLAGSSNGRAYDPTPAIASLIADPNIDNDMLRQAVMLEYPGYDVDSLLGRRSA